MLYHSWLASFHGTPISVNGPFVELILPAPGLIHLPRPKQGGALDGEESPVGKRKSPGVEVFEDRTV